MHLHGYFVQRASAKVTLASCLIHDPFGQAPESWSRAKKKMSVNISTAQKELDQAQLHSAKQGLAISM